MSTPIKQKNWKKEFDKIKHKKSFIEFYCEKEDIWLQYSDWDQKIIAIFGSYKNAVLKFRSNHNTKV